MPELLSTGNVKPAIAAGGVKLDVDPLLVALVAEHGQETDSNANGAWLRFANGVQITWITSCALSRQTNDYLRATWTFPQPFTSLPAVVFQLRDVNTTPNLTHLTLNRLGTANLTLVELVAYRQIGQANFAAGDTATAAAIAIGRWK